MHAYLQRRFSPVASVLSTSYAGLTMAEQFRLLADTTVPRACSPHEHTHEHEHEHEHEHAHEHTHEHAHEHEHAH